MKETINFSFNSNPTVETVVEEEVMDSGPRLHVFSGLSLNYSWRAMRKRRLKDGEEEQEQQRERDDGVTDRQRGRETGKTE